VQDGNLVSLAETVCKILNEKDFVHGAVSKTLREKRDTAKSISERRFILGKKGACNHLIRVKIEADGFEKGNHMGLQAHHNFVADPEIPGYTIMSRRIPCLCHGCRERFTKPFGKQYLNPCDDCIYFGIYDGYNNWKKISLRERKDCDQEDIVMAQEWTLKKIGERMAEKIVIKRYGAYLVDNAHIKYYLVQWTTLP
jgi:hypothetical protein